MNVGVRGFWRYTMTASRLHSMEFLEARRLLSISLVNGDLTVKATSGDDMVVIDSNDNPLRINVRVNSTIRHFNTIDVNRIIVNGLAGRDAITIESTVGATILTSLYGAQGNDTIRGGVGNDAMFGGDQNDLLVGGAGRDTLRGEAGDDRVNGNGGSDFV